MSGLEYGDVALTICPPTQHDWEKEKKDLRDKALLAHFEEEEKGQGKEPQIISNPQMAKGLGRFRCWMH